MIALSPVRDAPSGHQGALEGAAVARQEGSILSSPSAATAAGMRDVMSLIHALITRLDDASRTASKPRAVSQTAARGEQRKKEQHAIDEHAGKIAGDVAGVAAVAAASVVTFGAAAAVAVVAMSVTGALLNEDMRDVMKQVHDSHERALQSLQQAMQACETTDAQTHAAPLHRA